MPMRSALACMLVLVAACSRRAGPAPPATEVHASLADKGFFGRITPRTATPLHAPLNVFRVKGWNSRSNWIKLVDVVADGTRIEAGKEVARFEFPHEDALPWIKKRLAEGEADLERARTWTAERTRSTSSNAALAALTRQRAELDTHKAGLVSERDLSLLKLGFARATVEEEAATGLAAAMVGQNGSELALYEARAAEWKVHLARYGEYEKKTHVLAPDGGWVRYGYLNHARRKLQKPDDMPSGTPFVYVAADERLSVELYVPEHRVAAIAIGKTVQVRLPDDEKRAPATVRTVAPFPQEIGFLRGDDELPDAHEKAYVVVADLEAPPPQFSSGIEVRVEP
jgi:hypothetical protein